MRYVDLNEIIKFILYINNYNYLKNNDYTINDYFNDINLINRWGPKFII